MSDRGYENSIAGVWVSVDWVIYTRLFPTAEVTGTSKERATLYVKITYRRLNVGFNFEVNLFKRVLSGAESRSLFYLFLFIFEVRKQI